MKRSKVLLYIALLAAALTVHVINLTRMHIQFDEAASYRISSGFKAEIRTAVNEPVPASNFVRTIKRCADGVAIGAYGFRAIAERLKEDNHPPLYFILMYGWRSFFGDSLIVCRLLPLLFTLMAIGVIGLIAFRIGGVQQAWAAGAIFAWVPAVVQHSGMLRMYSLAVLLYVSALLAILRIWELQQNDRALRPWQLLLGLSLAAGILTHYYFVFWAVGLVCALISLVGPKRAARLFVMPGLIALFCALPWLYSGLPLQHLIIEGGGLSNFTNLAEFSFADYLSRSVAQIGALFSERKMYASGNRALDLYCLLFGSVLLGCTALMRGKLRPQTYIGLIVPVLCVEALLDLSLGRITMGWGDGRTNMFLTVPVVLALSGMTVHSATLARLSSGLVIILIAAQSLLMLPSRNRFEDSLFKSLGEYFRQFRSRTDVALIAYEGRSSLAQILLEAPCDLNADVITIKPGASLEPLMHTVTRYSTLIWVGLHSFALPAKQVAMWELQERKFQAILKERGYKQSVSQVNPQQWKPVRSVAIYSLGDG